MADVYLILKGRRVLYCGGRYGFQLIVNYLENIGNLTFRVIKARGRKIA